MTYQNKKFYNLPKPLKSSDYEECLELVKNSAKINLENNQDIKALYLMGGAWKAGISDMDIVVIYKNIPPKQYLQSPWSLGDKAKFIFTHRYLSFSEEPAKLFYFLYPKATTNLRLIMGEPINFLEPIGEEARWTGAFILFDVLLNKLLLFKRFQKGKVNVRNLIGELYSLHYTFDLLFQVTGERIGRDFEEKISQLRQNWFNMNESGGLYSLPILLDSGIKLVSETVSILDNFLKNKNVPTFPQMVFSNKKYLVRFGDNLSSNTVKFSIFGRQIEYFKIVMPISFSFFFKVYSSSHGEFGQAISDHLNPNDSNAKISDEILNKTSSHTRAMDMAFRDSLITHGYLKIPFSFGLPISREGIKGRMLGLIIKLVG